MDLYTHTPLRGNSPPSNAAQTSEAGVLPRLASLELNHGTDPQWIRDQIARAEAKDAEILAMIKFNEESA